MNQRTAPPIDDPVARHVAGRTSEVISQETKAFRRPGVSVQEVSELEALGVVPPSANVVRPVSAAAPAPSEPKPQQQPAPEPHLESYSEKDANYTQVFLPSQFLFYPFKTLSLRTIRASEQAKIARAAAENSMLHLVEAMSATLEPGVSAFDLTIQDFYWVMYWQRLNSYSKAPYMHRTRCTNPNHIQKVLDKELPEKSLEISELITRTSLSVKDMDVAAVRPFLEGDGCLKDRLPFLATLGYYSTRDMIALQDAAEDKDAEWEWLATRACYLDSTYPLEERIQMVKNMDPDTIEELQAYIEATSQYGVSEIVAVKCKECGAEMMSNIFIEALSFLPGSQ